MFTHPVVYQLCLPTRSESNTRDYLWSPENYSVSYLVKPKPQALGACATCCLLSVVNTEEVTGGRNKGAAQEGRWGRGSKSASFLRQFCACATTAVV